MSLPLDTLIENALVAEPDGSGTRERILDAALAMFLEFGTRRTTIDDVARRAAIGRATVYRAFTDKNALIQAVLLRESARSIREIGRRVDGIADPAERFVETFVFTVLGARNHPLVQRLFDIEADWLLPHFTTGGGAVMEISRRWVASRFRAQQALGHLTGMDADDAAELCVRLLHSLVLTPGARVSAHDETSLRRYARDFLLPLLRGRRLNGDPPPA